MGFCDHFVKSATEDDDAFNTIRLLQRDGGFMLMQKRIPEWSGAEGDNPQ